MRTLRIYTDGSCLRHHGNTGGYCAVIIDGDKKTVVKGGEPTTTSNRMELKAVVEALKELKDSCHIEIYSDSRYVVDGINIWIEKWRKNTSWKKTDRDLWKELDMLLQKHKVKAYWIKGRSEPENKYCDRIAKKEAKKQ